MNCKSNCTSKRPPAQSICLLHQSQIQAYLKLPQNFADSTCPAYYPEYWTKNMVFNKLRSLLSHSRLPLRIASVNPRPKVYRVRIRTAERSSIVWPFMSAASLFVVTRLAMGDSDKTYFIPLTLSREVQQPQYTKDDPVVQIYQKFSQDFPLQAEVQSESIQPA